MFESTHTNPDDVPRIGQKLTKMNSSQMTHMIHHMFDGITHNHNTNGSIARMRKDYPVDPQNPAAMVGHMDGPVRQFDMVPPMQPPPNGPGPDMGHLPGVGMMGMANYGDAFQMSANVQAEASMNEEERRRRFGDGRLPIGAVMNDFESSLNASKIPFRPPPSDGNKSSAEENDEEDENDYEEEFEDTRTMEERQAGKPPPPRRKIAFNCFQCQKAYRCRKSLVRHHKKHPGFCADCGVKRGFTLEEVIAHSTQHHIARYPFVCDECGESFRRNQQFKDHAVAVHGRDPTDKNNKDQPSICDICGDRFTSLQLLKKHVLKMHKSDAKKYGCKYCEKSFTLKSNLERHMRLHTEVQKGFICEKCGAEYFSSQALKDHCNQAHVEMKPFECDFCKKRFSHQRSLRKHAQSHSEERPFVCDICVQAFKHKTHLVRHKQSVHHEQPAKKKFKRMQENNKGELVPVVEAPRTKTPSGKAGASTSKSKQPDAPAAIDGPKHYQGFPENNMFYNQQHDFNSPSALPPNTPVPMQSQHSNMLGYVNQPGRPQSQQQPHQIPQSQHMQHPHQPHLHPSIPNGPHPQNHHHMQHHPPHHPHPHQNPMHQQHHPQFHPQHMHHQPPHHLQQTPMQMQPPPHHLQSQSPHLVPPHRQMPVNAYAPALDNQHNNHFAMNNNNNSNNSNANMYQQQQPQQQQQHFQPNTTPNHEHFQTSFAFKTEPPQQSHQPPPPQQQQQQHPPQQQQQQQHHSQLNHHQVPSSNSPHIKLEPFNDAGSRPGSNYAASSHIKLETFSDAGSRPGSNYAASSYDQSNNWNMNVPTNTPQGPHRATTTPTGAGPPVDTSRNTASANKMFSLVEVNSGEYMKVEMPPPFTKQELNDVDLLQYQNLWDTDSTPTQQSHMNYIEPAQTNSYNNIGSILSNLELLGNNATFDSNSFEIITNNFDQAQQQQPQTPVAQPPQTQPPAVQQQQQQHQPAPITQQLQPQQLQPQQQHIHPHQMHLQRQHAPPGPHPHHPAHLPPHAVHPNKPLSHPGHMNPDNNMSYFNNQVPINTVSAPQSSGPGNYAQPPHANLDNNNSIAYQNHTITDISNTFLTENQRNNLQQHVDFMQPTTSTAMASPSAGNFYAAGAGGGPIRTGAPPQVAAAPKSAGASDSNVMPSLTEYLHNPM